MEPTLQFGQNIFDEREIQNILSRLSGKWVIHLKAVGLLKYPEKLSNFINWYSDKSHLSVIGAIINSSENSREIYIMLDTQEEVEHAYEHWFPLQSELLDSEDYLFVEFKALSPDGNSFITNESISI